VRVESFRSLDVNKLNRHGLLIPGAVRLWGWFDSAGEETASLAIAALRRDLVLLLYRLTSPYVGDITFDAQGKTDLEREGRSWIVYPVVVTWTPCNYGGSRPWLHCPNRGCGRRVVKLHLGDRYFGCRRCYRLAYASQTERCRERLQRRRDKLLDRLDHGYKPSGMHRSTYSRILNELDELDMAIDDEIFAGMERLMRQFPGKAA
jgi:hypothetical protein